MTGFLKLGLNLALMVSLIPFAASAAGGLDEFTQQLIELRSQLEQENQELVDLQAKKRLQLESSIEQRQQLEQEISEVGLRVAQMKEEARLLREQISRSTAAKPQSLSQPLASMVKGFRDFLEQSLPFQQEARLKALTDIEKNWKDGLLSDAKTHQLLWSLLADEARLTKSNQLQRQVVRLGGQDVLSQVATLGMGALFFETPSGEVGFAKREGSSWLYTKASSDEDSKAISIYISAQRKQIRQGYFDLPILAFGAIQ